MFSCSAKEASGENIHQVVQEGDATRCQYCVNEDVNHVSEKFPFIAMTLLLIHPGEFQ